MPQIDRQEREAILAGRKAVPQIGAICKGMELGYSVNSGYSKFIWVACIDCGKERWVALKGSSPRTKRCPICSGKRQVEIIRRRNGRQRTRQGYILLHLQPDDFFFPMAKKDGHIFEHRLVVAKALGRCLHRWEIVHHKHAKYPAGSKEDKADNRYPENLQLVTDDRHRQITILERQIDFQAQRITKLEAELTLLRTQLEANSAKVF